MVYFIVISSPTCFGQCGVILRHLITIVFFYQRWPDYWPKHAGEDITVK